jgi:nicotinate dehydrogenase subunit B
VDAGGRVTDVHACLDAGEIINPDDAINQTEGGIVQAISWTVKEALTFDGPASPPPGERTIRS